MNTATVLRTCALGLLAMLAFSLAGTARAAGDYDACTGFVTTAQFTIPTPGTWCMTQNLSAGVTTPAGIDIRASDVILDCNGFRLDATPMIGVYSEDQTGVAALNRSNITIRNCFLRGFRNGIYLTNASSPPSLRHVVEDNRIELSEFIGIFVNGNGSVIRRNTVLTTRALYDNLSARGIETDGDVDVLDNLVSGVTTTNADVAGIFTQRNNGGSIRGNRVRGVVRNGTTGTLDAIRNQSASLRVVIRGNDVTGEGLPGSVGIFCDVPTDRAKNNSIKGFASAITGCSDDGNVIKP